MATRKISDLTLLTDVSSSDTLLLLDNSDPVDTNKKSLVGSIFKAVPGGTQNTPGLAIELKTATGVYSETQGSIGFSMGDAKLQLQKQSTALVISARDSADANLDLSFQALGTGTIRFNSPIAIDDSVFELPNSSDQTKVVKFSAAQIPSGVTRTYVLPDPGQTDTLVTLTTAQTLTNKTLTSPIITGSLQGESLTLSGNLQVDNNTTIGSSPVDTMVVTATSTFNSNTTFNQQLVVNAIATHSEDIRINVNSDSPSYKRLEWFDAAQDTNAGRLVLDVNVQSSEATRYADFTYYDRDTDYTSTDTGYSLRVATNGFTLPQVTVVLNGDALGSFVINDPGSGLTDGQLTATVVGDGTFGAVTPVIINGQLTGLTIDAGGANYTTATIQFSATGGALQYRTWDYSSSTETTETVIHTGNLKLISEIGSINNLVTTGTVNFDQGTFQLDSVNSIVGIGLAPSQYKLEVGGDIYFEGTSLIGGDNTSFIIKKRLQSVPLTFADYSGALEMIIDTSGDVGIGKLPTAKLDVNGSAAIQGDLTVNETDPVNQVGGGITAKRLTLIDLNNQNQTITSEQIAASSRLKTYFHAYS